MCGGVVTPTCVGFCVELGAHQAMYFADDALMCTNPELSSVRDADKMIGILTRYTYSLTHRPTVCKLGVFLVTCIRHMIPLLGWIQLLWKN